jgi:TonB family protein
MQRLAAVLAASLLFALALGRDSSATAGPPAPQQPEVLSPVAPEYPSLARAARARGVVVVEVQVNADGSVASAQAMSGHPLLQRSAAGAASRWRFKPGARAASARLTFDFRWEQAEEEVKPDSPYHLVVYRPQPPDTENRVPPDAEDQTCEVHGFKLERDKVSISSGLRPRGRGGFEDALPTLEPARWRRLRGH